MSTPGRPKGEYRSAKHGGCLMTRSIKTAWLALAVSGAALLAGCERPPVNTVQHGYRGLAMVEVYNPRILATQATLNQAPETPAAASPDGPRAGQIYKNLKVLGDLSVGEFARNMVAITAWVAPKEGCTYCHAAENYADDGKYTKVVARRMLQMTQHINADWKTHVADTGVTCYTCHRGNPVPAKVWFTPAPASPGSALLAGQNAASQDVAFASLPNDPFTPFLLKATEIRVIGTEPLPMGNRQSIKQTEWTYGLMMHMSQSLGVNCTYCHNTRSFAQWDASTPQRAIAWYSIRMVRDVNNTYIDPLASVFPAHRLGPNGDSAKVNCATCHQGAYKPLYGAQMLKGFPELAGPIGALAAAQPVAATAADGEPGKMLVLFLVGRSELSSEALRVISLAAADITAHPGQAVDLSGYADKSGNADANLELAKQRAFAVRDALKAAGVADDRIRLKKPEFVIGGAEADARRVEIALAK